MVMSESTTTQVLLPKWAARDKILTNLAWAAFVFCLGWGCCSANYRVALVPQAWSAAHKLAKVQGHDVPVLKQKLARSAAQIKACELGDD